MRTAIVFFIIISIPAVAYSQTTWYVDGTNTSGPWLGTQADPFQNIQDGIDIASNGDTVLVLPYSYLENIDFMGKAITVTSEKGPDVTIIDGGNPPNPNFGSAVIFQANEGPDSVLEGFTVTNGSGTSTAGSNGGGGIICIKSSPKILNNIITNNQALNGGGICCIYMGASPEISCNIIILNKVTGALNNIGGGIGCFYSAAPLISKNIIASNSSEYGGGIGLWGDTAPVISGNFIYANIVSGGVVHNGSYGGGIGIGENTDCNLSNNIIVGNKSEFIGGGIGIHGIDNSTFINNTIFGNQAQSYGGGICIFDDTTVTLSNEIFWNNQAPTGPQIALLDIDKHFSSMTISFSDVQGGQPLVHVDPDCSLHWGSGMIDADPLFVDPANDDFHLSWVSPCINRGTNDGAPSEDFDGDTRPYMGTVDMGMDEFIGIHPLEADLFALSELTGGIVNLSVNSGVNNAGRNYLILGSITGTAPGTPLPGDFTTLALNWDIFTSMVFGLINTPVFLNFMGSLDGSGMASAQFNTLAPIPGTAGITIHFAYALNNPWDFVSNPVGIEIVP